VRRPIRIDGDLSRIFIDLREAAMASIPGLSTKLICFDTSIVDLTDQLADPVEVLFGVQLAGGTDINAALAYCEKQIESPSKTHLYSSPIYTREEMPTRCWRVLPL
jgi:hypothetical protein